MNESQQKLAEAAIKDWEIAESNAFLLLKNLEGQYKQAQQDHLAARAGLAKARATLKAMVFPKDPS